MVKTMKIAVGSDHAGFALKEHVRAHVEAAGHDVADVGTFSAESVDYPDFAAKVALAVVRGEAERGILVCGTGLGVSMTANRFRGVRAAPCTGEFAAEMTRRHNDANVLCLGGRLVTKELAERIVDVFLSTPFEGGRHARRVAKIDDSACEASGA
ncbi:MAG: ribose 5-phosphate isomerase B [Planctomycetota bacterium]|jgi:ribose 5-phosphate isomerase B